MTQDNAVFYAQNDEMAVLGCALSGDQDAAQEAVTLLHSDSVFNVDVLQSLSVIATALKEGRSISMMTMSKEWSTQVGTPPLLEFWSKCIDRAPSPSGVTFFIEGVKEAAHRRHLREASALLAAECGNPTIPIGQIIANLERKIAVDSVDEAKIIEPKQTAQDFIADTEVRFTNRGKLSGVTTGFRRLDEMTGGIQYGDMFLVAARPSIGKTAFAGAVTLAACIGAKIPTLFVTCEMSKVAVYRRLVAAHGNIKLQKLKEGDLDQREFAQVSSVTAKFSTCPLYFLEIFRGETVAHISAAIRRAVRKYNVKLVIIDYLQVVQPSEKRELKTYDIADVSGTLKSIARTTGVALLCLAQVNRKSEVEGRRPSMSDLAESGQIERDADVICLLERDRNLAIGEAEIIVAKQRDGETGVVDTWYDGPHVRFEDRGTTVDYP